MNQDTHMSIVFYPLNFPKGEGIMFNFLIKVEVFFGRGGL